MMFTFLAHTTPHKLRDFFGVKHILTQRRGSHIAMLYKLNTLSFRLTCFFLWKTFGFCLYEVFVALFFYLSNSYCVVLTRIKLCVWISKKMTKQIHTRSNTLLGMLLWFHWHCACIFPRCVCICIFCLAATGPFDTEWRELLFSLWDFHLQSWRLSQRLSRQSCWRSQ